MQREMISSWIDGESEHFDISQHLPRDTALLEKWRNYHLIRDVMRSDASEVIYLDIAGKVQEALKNEPLPIRKVRPIESQPSPAGIFRFPTWRQSGVSWGWVNQLTQMAFAASVALAVIVGVQYYNVSSSPMLADNSVAPAMDTLPVGGVTSPVSYGVPSDSKGSSLQQVQEQHRRINALLQDYELQRRLHAEQLSADGEAKNRGASVQSVPQINEQSGSGTHLQ